MTGNIIFFDTETSGLPSKNLPRTHFDQPHICQLGAILTDSTGRTLHEINMIVKPDGWVIPAAASDLHGITQEIAMGVGLSIRGVLGVFARLLEKASTIVAHNIAFDLQMLEREMQPYTLPAVAYCTMAQATPILAIPPTENMRKWGMTQFKNPNLQECHEYFFGRPFDGAHDAMADVRACRDVYFEIERRKTSAS